MTKTDPSDHAILRAANRINRSNPSVSLSLSKIAAELHKCSPEFRDLLALALTGANGETAIADSQTQAMARMRINEALAHPLLLTDAKARAAATGTETIRLLRAFVADVEAVGLEHVQDDLAVTYHKAKRLLEKAKRLLEGE